MAYVPILLLLCIGLILGVILTNISRILSPKAPNRRKDMPFECGVPTVGDTKRRFSVRFFLVAILFLLFDVEAIFFFPWAVTFRKFLAINSFILIEMGAFVGVLLLGYFYVLKKGALEWE